MIVSTFAAKNLKTMKDLDTYSTYYEDQDLFTELCIPRFKEIPNWTSIRVGETYVSDCKVEIWVEGAPAQFWTFNIEFPQGEKKRVSTGSGSLADYWKSIEYMCSGCLIIEDVKNE